MKIGILTNLYPPIARGGAEQVARRIAHELHIRGHDIFVFSTKPYTGVKSIFSSINERSVEAVYRFFPINLYHTTNDYKHSFPVRALWHLVDLYVPFSSRELGHVLDREKPDVVLSHNVRGLGFKAFREVRNRNIPNIHTVHDVQLSIPSGLVIHGEEEKGLNGTFLRNWFERYTKQIINSPEIVVSPSKFLADFYSERGFFPDSKVELMPNPVPHTPNVHRSLTGGPLVLLYVGQLEEHKGVKFLLETLNKFEIQFTLHIAGEGRLSSYVADWAANDPRVVYHGYVESSHLNQLLAITDVSVVPSLCCENSPTVIYESFGSGVPVIASDIGGVGELIEHGKNGYLFVPGDSGGFLKALRTFEDKKQLFRSRAAEIRQDIEPYSIVRYVDRLEGMIKDIL